MTYIKLPRLLFSGAIVLLLVHGVGAGASSSVRTEAALQATAPGNDASNCTALAATPAGTMRATVAATLAATNAPTTEATLAATENISGISAGAPLRFVSFLPTDIRFNPDPDKPVALVIVFSLIFDNQLAEQVHIAAPRFQLAINDVPWGMLSSTDFQTGQLSGHAEQGIVLQSLTIISKTMPEQQAVLACLKAHVPLDLTLTGTLDVYPGGVKQSVAVHLVTPQIVVREQP